MKNHTAKNRMLAVFAGVTLALGVASPAFAEATRTSSMKNWKSSYASNSWYDFNKDNTKTSVTFHDCTREFRATIRKTIPGPDPKYATEWIDCKAYADAVRGGNAPASKYHFDVTGFAGTTTVKKLTQRW